MVTRHNNAKVMPALLCLIVIIEVLPGSTRGTLANFTAAVHNYAPIIQESCLSLLLSRIMGDLN